MNAGQCLVQGDDAAGCTPRHALLRLATPRRPWPRRALLMTLMPAGRMSSFFSGRGTMGGEGGLQASQCGSRAKKAVGVALGLWLGLCLGLWLGLWSSDREAGRSSGPPPPSPRAVPGRHRLCSLVSNSPSGRQVYYTCSFLSFDVHRGGVPPSRATPRHATAYVTPLLSGEAGVPVVFNAERD